MGSVKNVGISYKTVLEGLRVGLQSPRLVYNLVGYSGIGKTAIVRQVVSELGGRVFEVNSSLLQAGDLAMPVKHELEDGTPVVKYIVNEMIRGVNRQAKEDPEHIYVIFFDEFNRADAEVQSDLMNLILQRQLFDVVLEPNVRVVTAQNPDRTTEGFEDTNYDVHEVDEATASRVVDIRMRYSSEDWLEFGKTYDTDKDRYNVHPMVTAYIANGNEDMLLVFNEDKRNTPSPRNWTRVGDLLYDFGVEDFIGVDDSILNFIRESIIGTVGGDYAISFMSFGETFTDYIKVSDLVNADEEEFDRLVERYDGYESTKKVSVAEDFVAYMLEDRSRVEDEGLNHRVAHILGKAPMDTVRNQVRVLVENFSKMYGSEVCTITVTTDEGIEVEQTLQSSQLQYLAFIQEDDELHEKITQTFNNDKVLGKGEL